MIEDRFARGTAEPAAWLRLSLVVPPGGNVRLRGLGSPWTFSHGPVGVTAGLRLFISHMGDFAPTEINGFRNGRNVGRGR